MSLSTAQYRSLKSTLRASLSGVVYALPLFPDTVQPSVWFDGWQQAYSDAAGLVPVASGIIRRINEPVPLTGAWTTPSDTARPTRDTGSVRLDLNSAVGGCELNRPAVAGIYGDACTLVVSYMARDNAFAGPLMGLLEVDTATVVGIEVASDAVTIRTTAGIFTSGLRIAPGKMNVISATYTPNGVTVRRDADGVVTTETWSPVGGLAHTAVTGNWVIGRVATNYLYGSVSQAIVVNRALSSAELDGVMSWAKAQTMPEAYPTTSALIAYVGDSIPRMTACAYGLGYPFLSLATVRATKPSVENCDCAIGGSGVSGILTPSANNQFYLANSFYSSARAKNIMVIALGSNDLANGNGATFTVRGTGAPNIPGSGLFPLCDAARAVGWKVVLLTIGPRLANISQATFNADRLAANTIILNEGTQHADAVVNTTDITNFGFDNDYLNTTYYSGDQVHPIAAGHALVPPRLSPAILSLL